MGDNLTNDARVVVSSRGGRFEGEMLGAVCRKKEEKAMCNAKARRRRVAKSAKEWQIRRLAHDKTQKNTIAADNLFLHEKFLATGGPS